MLGMGSIARNEVTEDSKRIMTYVEISLNEAE